MNRQKPPMFGAKKRSGSVLILAAVLASLACGAYLVFTSISPPATAARDWIAQTTGINIVVNAPTPTAAQDPAPTWITQELDRIAPIWHATGQTLSQVLHGSGWLAHSIVLVEGIVAIVVLTLLFILSVHYLYASRRLKASRAFIYATIDAVAAQIAVIDDGGTILFTNKAWRSFPELPNVLARSSMGTNYLAVCDLASGHGSREACELATGLREVIAGRSEQTIIETKGASASGEVHYLCRLSRFDGQTARTRKASARAVVSFEDISARKQAEDRARKAKEAADSANQAKSAFLANMSHELRTPMTAILGYADMLLDSARPAAEREKCARTIRRNGEHLLAVINDVLDLSKIEAEKMAVERISCDPVEILADVLSLTRVRATDKGLDMSVVFDGPIPKQILTDPLRLRQILVNLVGNAIKFTSTGSVRLRVACHDAVVRSTLQVDVADTGIGMNQQQLGKLFRAFTQGDDSTTRQYGGTGLGLSISRKLSGLLGGDIAVQSRPHVGSTFSVWVDTGPLVGIQMRQGLSEKDLAEAMDDATSSVAATFSPPPAIEASAPPRGVRERAPSAPAKIAAFQGTVVLAEDGEDNRALIGSYLQHAGVTVLPAENGQIALDLALSNDVDLVLMDMQMPVLDGYNATRQLREKGFTKPIVALTANAMADDRQRCIAAGCDDYVAKPIELDAFARALAKYLKPAAGAAVPAPVSCEPRSSLTSSLRTTGTFDNQQKVLERFISRLPERVAELVKLTEQQNLKGLETAIHKLKGAAGGYGFPQISAVASKAEQLIRADAPLDTVADAIDEIVNLMARVDGYREHEDKSEKPANESAPLTTEVQVAKDRVEVPPPHSGPKLRVDPISGLFNHRYLLERLPTELSLSRRRSRPLSLVRLLSDTPNAGAAMDNELLRAIGCLLQAGCRSEQIPFRLDDNSFAVLMPGFTSSQALELGNQLCKSIASEAMTVNGQLVAMSMRCAVAEAGPETCSAQELLVGAEKPLAIS